MEPKIKFCVECPFSKVVPDPDPSDWFNDDDEAILCEKTPHKPKLDSKYAADKHEFKPVSSSLRPYETHGVEVPTWCPLKKKK